MQEAAATEPMKKTKKAQKFLEHRETLTQKWQNMN